MWEICKEQDYSEDLAQRLKNGWEPYAVVLDYGILFHFLRRKVS